LQNIIVEVLINQIAFPHAITMFTHVDVILLCFNSFLSR